MSWDEFIEQYVVSRPRRNLDELKISSTSTWAVSNCFSLIMRLASLVPVKYMVPLLLESNFFSKWRYATYGFLMGVMLRPEQATSWYESWKLFVPLRLLINILDGGDVQPAYDMLIKDAVVPSVKASPWKVWNPSPMIHFMKTWKDALPPSAVRVILDEAVLPELIAAAVSWSPWIPHLGVCTPPSRQNSGGGWMGVTSSNVPTPRWHSGRTCSTRRRGKSSIVPLVIRSLRNLKISPARTWERRSNTFPLVMRWALLVPDRYMVPILMREFFPNWRQTVYRFLMEVRPLPSQATAWYESWKGLFTPELLASVVMLLQLDTGLYMIDCAAQGLEGIEDPVEIDVCGPRNGNAALAAVEGAAPAPAPAAVPGPAETAARGGNGVDVEMERTLATLSEEGAAYDAAREERIQFVTAAGGGSRGVPPASAEKEVIRALAVVFRESALDNLTLGGLIHEFTGLKEKFPVEYVAHRLDFTAARLAAPLLRPLLRARYGRRDLLQKPSCALALVQSLRNILHGGDVPAAATSAYDMLINDAVVPSVKASTWKVWNPSPMIHFMEMWKDALPSSAVRVILEEVVLPELIAAAESWSPTSWPETGSVWVSPWIPHLGVDRLRGVYAAITAELGRWMDGRDVARCSDTVVAQWKDVFDPATWDELVLVHVVPLVIRSLRNLKISPARTWERRSSTFPLVTRWALLVPDRYMVPILVREFFPKWRQAVYRFLMVVRPLPSQATAWYESWKGLFTPELLDSVVVLLQLESGLDMIDCVAQGLEVDRPDF
uniref:GCF C-terminal domain-containing protein n=1 Tax=Leersia perrieri TaxID=77586 RepID=A0A0D9W742_9ORYZ